MSRLDHDIERGLQQIADRATPSPDAWAQIQSRIADQDPIQETEIIMLTENTTPTRRWPLIAAAAAVVALAVTGIFLVNRGDGDTLPADDPPAPTLAPSPDPEAAPDDPTAMELPVVDSQVPPGRYESGAPGVTVTFTLDEGRTAPWTVVSNQEPGGIQLWSDDTGREFIAIGRVGSWYDANEARDESTTGLGSIPPDDIDRWIEENGIIVTESADIEVGNRPAQYRQIRLDTSPGASADFCPSDEQPCLWAATGSADTVGEGPGPIPFSRDRLHSIWLVDMDDYEPLVILAIPNLDDEQAWFDTIVQPIVDSMEFGEPAPAVEGGAARVSTFDGATGTLELPQAGATLEPGRYASDALGVPVEFDIGVGQTAPWNVMNEEPGRLWLISKGSDQEFVAMGRLGSWYDATQARTQDTTGLGSIPPDDIDGWIAQNGIIVVDSADVEVGGRTANYRQFRLDTTPGATADFCGASAPCLWVATGSPDVLGGTANPIEVGYDRAQSIWLVDMGEFEPVYVFAAAHLGDGDEQWFTDVVQPIVDSIVFGDPAPTVEGGTARVPERVTVSATYTGVRTDGEQLADGSTAISYAATTEGTITGDITGTGSTRVAPNASISGSNEYTFTGTIEGIGTGTLTYIDSFRIPPGGPAIITVTITGGTGDFAGITGSGVTTVDTSERVGPDDAVSGTNTFELAIPRSG